MAILTERGHVSRALDFFNTDNIYFGFGRQTPWALETIEGATKEKPEPPSVKAVNIEEPLGYKKVESKYLVVPDENGTLTYRDSRWRIVTPNEAYTVNCKWVYINCCIRYNEIPLGQYRQVGILTDLKKKAEVSEGKLALVPEEVENEGILQVLDNRDATTRQLDQKEQLSIIIEF